MSFYQNIYKLFAHPLRAVFRVQVVGGEKLPQERGCILYGVSHIEFTLHFSVESRCISR